MTIEIIKPEEVKVREDVRLEDIKEFEVGPKPDLPGCKEARLNGNIRVYIDICKTNEDFKSAIYVTIPEKLLRQIADEISAQIREDRGLSTLIIGDNVLSSYRYH